MKTAIALVGVILVVYALVSEMDYQDAVAHQESGPNVHTGCRMPTIDERLQATAVETKEGVWVQCVYFKALGYGTVGEPVEVELVPQKRRTR